MIKGMLPLTTAVLVALSAPAFAAELNTLTNLRVLPSGPNTQVVVSGNKAPTFTVFRLSEPDRLVVDLSTADAQAIKGHHEGEGAIAGVVVSQFSDERASVGRVMVALKDASTYDVRADGNKIVISVASASAKLASPEPTEAVAAVAPAVEEKRDSVTVAKVEAAPAVVPADEKPSSTDANVVTSRTDEHAVKKAAKTLKAVALTHDRLRLVADGEIARFDVIELTNPARLAVDLFNLGSTAKAPKARPNYLKDLRLGAHADKVRLVLEMNAEMPAYEIERNRTGVDIFLADAALAKRSAKAKQTAIVEATPSKRDDAEVVPEVVIDGKPVDIGASARTETKEVVAKAPEVKAPEKLAEIKDISFDEDGEGGRVYIKMVGDAAIEVVRPDPRSVVMTLTNVQIPKRLERAFDTSALKTPVKMISAFSVPGETRRVRIVAAAAVAFEASVENVAKTKDGLLWRLSVAEQKNEQAISKVATAGMSTEAETYASESSPRYSGKKVTFEFKDIDIHNLLRIIAEVSKKNIVVADDVNGRITIRLRNVPWDQALALILKSKQLGQQNLGNNIVRIAPQKTLDDEDKAREARIAAKKTAEPLVTQLIPINYAKAGDMGVRVKSVQSERGKIEVDERTNVLIVTDTAQKVSVAKSLVASLDTATPQVLIESRIVEANTSFTRQLGIQWGGNGQLAPSTGNATGLIFPNTVGVAGGAGQQPSGGTSDTPNYAVNLPVAAGQGVGGALGFLFGSAGGALNLNLRLSALENQGSVKTISSPKVTTMDNQTARISQGVDIPFSQASAAGVNTTFVQARLSLEVKPHITADGSVQMEIRAENNTPDPSNTGSNGQPAIQRKEANTQVLVKDGDTTVIGGIYVKSAAQSTAGLPFFSKIPVLGYFFKSSSELEQRQELLIFITPRIINRQVISSTL